jgi:hypothetical protein
VDARPDGFHAVALPVSAPGGDLPPELPCLAEGLYHRTKREHLASRVNTFEIATWEQTYMEIEGEPLKKYRLSYWGVFIGSYDTAKEALAEYDSHNKFIRPVTDPNNKGRYTIRDGRDKEIALADLKRAAAAE